MALNQLSNEHMSKIFFNSLINEETNKMMKLFSKSVSASHSVWNDSHSV